MEEAPSWFKAWATASNARLADLQKQNAELKDECVIKAMRSATELDELAMVSG